MEVRKMNNKDGSINKCALKALERRKGIVPEECRDKIALQDGTVALIDEDDFDRVNQYTWTVRSSDCLISSTINGKSVQLSRFIMEVTDSKLQVDHKNHDRRDNRKQNLRICTPAQNLYNTRPYNKLGIKGVYERAGKYRVYITINGKKTYLGKTDTKRNAASIYNSAASLFYGEFAYLNDLDSIEL